jgi:hypothetical protein
MRGAIHPLPQYIFMAWCLVKHRDNFTFTEKLKRYKSPGSDQILAELIQAGCNSFHSEIPKLNNSMFGIRKNCHSSGRNL